MRRALGLFVALVTLGQMSWAADVFVRDTKGSELSKDKANQITNSVKQAVQNTDEHSLASSEDVADFVLQPSLVSRQDQEILRIEKIQDGDTISMIEEALPSANMNESANTLAQAALQDESMPSRGVASTEAESQRAEQEQQASRAQSQERERDIASEEEAATSQQSGMATGGESRAAAGAHLPPGERGGYFTVGVGPSFAVGLESDSVMYNVIGAYNMDFNRRLTGKIIADLNFGSGTDSSRFTSIGVGANIYPYMEQVAGGRPYVGGSLSFGSVQNDAGNTEEGVAIGAGAGFQFSTQELNLDANLQYTLLTSEIDDDIPSVLGVRLAVNF